MSATAKAVVETVRTIISRIDDAEKDVISSAMLTGLDDAYSVMENISDSGDISSQVLNALAPLLRVWVEHGLFTRTPHDLAANVEQAARTVHKVFSGDTMPTPADITGLFRQLQQLFIFAVTCPAVVQPVFAPQMHQLSGVLHFVGALNKLQLAPPPSAVQPPVPDVGTAVFRCVAPSCSKIFSRLFHLQLHARLHDPAAPALDCNECDETFARAVDLKKHMDAHTFRCAGCDVTFESRESIEEHQIVEEGGDCDGADMDVNEPAELDMTVEEGEITPEAFYRAVHAALPLRGLLQAYASTAVAASAGLAPAAAQAGTTPALAPPRAPQARAPSKSVTPKVLNAKPATTVSQPPKTTISKQPVSSAPAKKAPMQPVAVVKDVKPSQPAAEEPAVPEVIEPVLSFDNDLIAQMMNSAAAMAEAELWEDYGEGEVDAEGFDGEYEDYGEQGEGTQDCMEVDQDEQPAS